jgi:hypothetical protein
MKKVRGSQSAFAVGDLVFTKYASGCLRSIMLADHGLRDTIDPKHQERGALNEEVYERGLQGRGVAYDRERTVSEPIDGFVDTAFVGRLDFLLPDVPPHGRVIVELKSTESPGVLKDVIKDGKYNLQNLAQLIAYMLTERCTHGQLVYTYFKKNKVKVYEKGVERVFVIEIDSEGRILVDQQPAPFTVHDYLHHRQLSAKVINEREIWARPYQPGGYDTPCRYCPFSKTCDMYDMGLIDDVDTFVSEASKNLVK